MPQSQGATGEQGTAPGLDAQEDWATGGAHSGSCRAGARLRQGGIALPQIAAHAGKEPGCFGGSSRGNSGAQGSAHGMLQFEDHGSGAGQRIGGGFAHSHLSETFLPTCLLAHQQ